jgi:hypothetical protein
MLGRDPTGKRFWDGLIDECALFDRALSADVIASTVLLVEPTDK